MSKAKKTEKPDDQLNIQELDFLNGQYLQDGSKSFNFTDSLRLWKTEFETFDDWKRNFVVHPILEPIAVHVKDVWDSIKAWTVKEAFGEKNIETRRIIFNKLGPKRIFEAMKPELLDKQTLHKRRARWDDKNVERASEYDDVYELYRIEGKKLFAEEGRNNGRVQDAYAVRCYCPSTNREYWIYVSPQAAMGGSNDWNLENKPDAVRAIAWTIQLNVSNPKRIIRQGDIIIAEWSDKSETVTPYHITKQQYVDLMYSET